MYSIPTFLKRWNGVLKTSLSRKPKVTLNHPPTHLAYAFEQDIIRVERIKKRFDEVWCERLVYSRFFAMMGIDSYPFTGTIFDDDGRIGTLHICPHTHTYIFFILYHCVLCVVKMIFFLLAFAATASPVFSYDTFVYYIHYFLYENTIRWQNTAEYRYTRRCIIPKVIIFYFLFFGVTKLRFVGGVCVKSECCI